MQKRVLPNCRRGRTRWQCLCDCGAIVIVRGENLKGLSTRSCGCLHRETMATFNHTHPSRKPGRLAGGRTSSAYALWEGAKRRSREKGLPFDLDPSDIVIPEFCPVMGVPLVRHLGFCQGDSPTLDKIDPALGYVKGNVWVISNKANSWKRNYTVPQLQEFVRRISDFLGGRHGG